MHTENAQDYAHTVLLPALDGVRPFVIRAIEHAGGDYGVDADTYNNEWAYADALGKARKAARAASRVVAAFATITEAREFLAQNTGKPPYDLAHLVLEYPPELLNHARGGYDAPPADNAPYLTEAGDVVED